MTEALRWYISSKAKVPGSNWLDAHNDPLANIRTLSQCMVFADISTDGDNKLIVADFGNRSLTGNVKVKVYKGRYIIHCQCQPPFARCQGGWSVFCQSFLCPKCIRTVISDFRMGCLINKYARIVRTSKKRRNENPMIWRLNMRRGATVL